MINNTLNTVYAMKYLQMVKIVENTIPNRNLQTFNLDILST